MTEATIIGDGILTIAPDKRSVRFRQQPVSLTKREFDLIALLAGRPDVIMSLEKLGETLDCKSPRSVSKHVSRVRRKFEAVDPEFAAIVTYYGEGYAWAEWLS